MIEIYFLRISLQKEKGSVKSRAITIIILRIFS